MNQSEKSKPSDMGEFSTVGCCLFWLLVGVVGGGITAVLIVWIVPWALDFPLPIVAYVPLAAVGAAGPIALFLLLCKYSRAARRFFFVQATDSAANAEQHGAVDQRDRKEINGIGK